MAIHIVSTKKQIVRRNESRSSAEIVRLPISRYGHNEMSQPSAAEPPKPRKLEAMAVNYDLRSNIRIDLHLGLGLGGAI